MKNIVLTIFFLCFLNFCLYSAKIVDQNKLNYMHTRDGYLQEVTQKNSALMYESVKRGVKVFSQKDIGKEDSYDPDVKYLPAEQQHSLEEIEETNKQLAEYNKKLESYYYEILEDLTDCQNDVYEEKDHVNDNLKFKLNVIEKLFEFMIKIKETDNIDLKRDGLKIFTEYREIKENEKDYLEIINRKLSLKLQKYKININI